MDWRAYTFAWRDDQADADLVPADGAETEVRQGEQKRVWQFHSRSQCMSCHSNQSEYALAFAPEQLNRPGLAGQNQLVAFTEAGYIRRADEDGRPLAPFDAKSAAREQKLADPTDGAQPPEARALSYLHANCGHCHSDHGGGSVPLRLKFPVAIAEMKAVGVRPTRGDFTLPGACIIKPGDPGASTLYYRMAKFGRDRMPHIGSERPDELGLEVIERWIDSLGAVAEKRESGAHGGLYDTLLSDPKSALPVARKMGRGELAPAERNSLLGAAAKLPPGPVRDLFEGYLPSDAKGARKLGSSPRPRAILAAPGDARRGEALFWSAAVNCGNCHKVGDRGTALGPDLSSIGKLRSRKDILESILEPSRRIEPRYATYLAQTADGRSIIGQLVRRNEHAVVLRDSQNQEIILSARVVEELQPTVRSLMPDEQLAGLTSQNAADLLEYLATRK
jgi:putative heme-binding domain-containing protein